MESPRRNLELKAIDDDPQRSLEACQRLGAEDAGLLLQRDVYFNVPRGRLKLRRENGARSQLIAYERPDSAGRRESRYRIIEVGNPTELEAALADVLGVAAVVEKSRRLFLHRGVRIHLDRIVGLGDFIELEAVAGDEKNIALSHLEVQLAELRGVLDIQDLDLLGGSYCDLILAAEGPEIRPA